MLADATKKNVPNKAKQQDGLKNDPKSKKVTLSRIFGTALLLAAGCWRCFQLFFNLSAGFLQNLASRLLQRLGQRSNLPCSSSVSPSVGMVLGEALGLTVLL